MEKLHLTWLGKNAVHIDVEPNLTDEEAIEISDYLMVLAGRGVRFVQNSNVRAAKAVFRKRRRFGVRRSFTPDSLLLPAEFPPHYYRQLPPGQVMKAYPDWELLEWCVVPCFARSIGVREIVYIPVAIDGAGPRPRLTPDFIRALMEWSQSYLEKYATELPGLLKVPGRYGAPLQVQTLAFLEAVNDPKYPFMVRGGR
jgi:hypothetical protein